MASYRNLAFASTEVEQLDGNHYRVTGDLTIKGVTNR
jgi:polyisoprenoid-binding protein YceI